MPENRATPDPFAVVKECKGAALSILVLLATNQQLGGGAVTQEWLARHTGYSDKPISQALAYLKETGRIAQTVAGWILAGRAPLGPASAEAGSPAKGCEDVAGENAGSPAAGQTSRKFSDSPTTTSAINSYSDPIKAAEEEARVGIIPTRVNLERVEANLAAFKKWGVGRNEKTIVLSSRPEVTPEQIDAVAQRLIGEKRFSTGLLITAVQSGDQPMPNLPNRYAGPEERDPSKYAQWEQ